MKKVIVGLSALILLTPLGLLASGTAWGEWGLEEIKAKLGYIPHGMSRFHETIRIIVPDYGIPGLGKNFAQSALGYILAAIIGTAVIGAIFYLIAKLALKNKTNSA